MSKEVDKLERQLEVAKSAEVLQATREAMHEDRSHEENMAAYKEASDNHAALRTKFREDYPPPKPEDVPEGDAVVTPETVNVTSEVRG